MQQAESMGGAGLCCSTANPLGLFRERPALSCKGVQEGRENRSSRLQGAALPAKIHQPVPAVGAQLNRAGRTQPSVERGKPPVAKAGSGDFMKAILPPALRDALAFPAGTIPACRQQAGAYGQACRALRAIWA